MNLPLINSEAATPFLGEPPIAVVVVLCVFLNFHTCTYSCCSQRVHWGVGKLGLTWIAFTGAAICWHIEIPHLLLRVVQTTWIPGCTHFYVPHHKVFFHIFSYYLVPNTNFLSCTVQFPPKANTTGVQLGSKIAEIICWERTTPNTRIKMLLALIASKVSLSPSPSTHTWERERERGERERGYDEGNYNLCLFFWKQI